MTEEQKLNDQVIKFLSDTNKSALLITSDVKVDIKVNIPVFDGFINNQLYPNNYRQHRQNPHTPKCIIIIPSVLLHPRLDPALYFAPIINNKIQKKLLTHYRYICRSPLPVVNVISSATATHSISGDDLRHHFLNQARMTHDKQMMQMLANHVLENDKFKQLLFNFIKAYLNNELLQSAATNVVTILCYARVPFSGLDLSGLNLSFADMRGGIFHKTKLRRCVLRHVQFEKSFFIETDMQECDLTGATFGQHASINHDEAVNCLLFSHDGRWLAAAVSNEIYLRRVSDNNILWTKDTVYLNNCVAFSSDGKRLCSATEEGKVWIWRVADGEQLAVLNVSEEAVRSVAFSPNNNILAVGGFSGEIQLWCTNTIKVLSILKRHEGTVGTLQFSADNQWLASGSSDNSVILWQVSTGESLHVFTESTKSVNSVCFCMTNNMQLLFAGVEDGNLYIWDLQTRQLLQNYKAHTESIEKLVCTVDQQIIISCSKDGSIKVWNTVDRSLLEVFEGHQNWITDVTVRSADRLIASSSEDNSIRFWQLSETFRSHQISQHQKSVTSVVMSNNGKYIASGDENEAIYVWRTKDGCLLQHLKGQVGAVSCLAFSPDNQYLVSGSSNGTVRVWGAYSWNLLHVIDTDVNNPSGPIALEFMAYVESVAFSADSQFIATAGRDLKIRLWRVTDGSLVRTFVQRPTSKYSHSDTIYKVVYSADNLLLASGCKNGAVGVWQAHDGKLIKILKNHEGAVKTVVFSPDSQLLVTAGDDNVIRLWRVEDLCLSKEFRGHDGCINCIVFSSNGEFLISASDDKSVRIWNIAAGKLCQSVNGHVSAVMSVVISPDGQWLVSSSADKAVRGWQLQMEKGIININLQWTTTDYLLAQGANLENVKGMSPLNQALFQQLQASHLPNVSYSELTVRPK